MENMKTWFFVIVVNVLFMSSFVIYKNKNDMGDATLPCFAVKKVQTIDNKKKEEFDSKVLSKLIQLAKDIKYAKQHVRGTKTGDALIRATVVMEDVLSLYNVSTKNVTQRMRNKAQSVCPEVYKGPKIGYPFFYTGFVVENCTYSKPLEKLITVLFNFHGNNSKQLLDLLNATMVYNHDLPIIVNAPKVQKDALTKIMSTYKHIKMRYMTGESGTIWNKLISKAKTMYVLIAREVTWFNHDARLDRLIRQIERLGVSSAGGSTRDAQGHWAIGCHQRALRNFTLVYDAGYDESIEACQFCDHVDGPFVMKTETALKISFNEKIKSEGLFEDFFMRMSKSEHIVCPDSLFFTNKMERNYDAARWKSFTDVYNVRKIKFSGKEIIIPCSSSDKCRPVSNGAISPCCHQDLSDLLVNSMEVCDRLGIICELDSGSVMGAVKFHSVLPWERDADMVFLSTNFSVIAKEKNDLKKRGYKLEPNNNVKSPSKGSNRKGGGFFYLKSKHWYVEMWGMSYLGSETELGNGQPQTRVSVNGHWVGMIRNPALYARNRYGKEIFQHAQHWSETKMASSWVPYTTNKFNKCGTPGHQSCLDRYNADGNLQFSDPIP